MPTCKNCVAGLLYVCHHEEYCRQEKEALLEQAQKEAEMEGHSLKKFTKVKRIAIWHAQCIRCGQVATISLNPSLGEPDVSGDAVSGVCPEAAVSEIEARTEKTSGENAWYDDLANPEAEPH